MSNLTVVGHFSTALMLAWLVWIAWLAGQMLWYRHLTAASDRPAGIALSEPGRAVPPHAPKSEPAITLRAPDPMIRSMGSAANPRTAAPPTIGPPAVEPAPVHDGPCFSLDASLNFHFEVCLNNLVCGYGHMRLL